MSRARGRSYQVNEVARIAGVSVRTLHHYHRRWFYPCSHAMHRGLADMYEADGRFAENIDKFGAGLTPFLSAAIRANASRNGA